MSPDFNYRHLHYFWVVAREGGLSRAAERLGMAVQTVSAQVRALEADLGCALLKPAGRGLTLTEAGLVERDELISQWVVSKIEVPAGEWTGATITIAELP